MTTSKIAVTEGSGKNIASYSATEDAVTKEVQRVALTRSDFTEGPSPGHAFDVTVTPTVTNGAYTGGDIVGALLTFAVARANDEKVIIAGIEISSKAAVTPGWTLVLFNADPTSTTKTDNAAYSLNAADAFKVIAAIPVVNIYDHGTPNTWQRDDLNLVAAPASGSQNIYGLLIDSVGVTLTSTGDIQVRLRGLGA
jgi:hypothetical protein